MLIVRNSFIQISKLTNVKGRIHYISSHKRQENLYAVYETTERKFWTELAKCNQTEFKKSGANGKCVEARELIIALPESFVEYDPEVLLQIFTKEFKEVYHMECIAALHHNKRKTNYHIHLIFSERRLLSEPEEKIATRNMFYDETGKHVRTKKEILDEAGQVRKGCKIIKKGEVYERNIFTTKYAYFKGEGFLNEVKDIYTKLINVYVKDEKEKQKVFDKNGMYLPMKKIGKNNPKAEQIKEDNRVRENWNQTVDRALVSGVSETEILEVKQQEIHQKVKKSIQKFGNRPYLFSSIVRMAVYTLNVLIGRIYEKILEEMDKAEKNVVKAEVDKIEVDRKEESTLIISEVNDKKTNEEGVYGVVAEKVNVSKSPEMNDKEADKLVIFEEITEKVRKSEIFDVAQEKQEELKVSDVIEEEKQKSKIDENVAEEQMPEMPVKSELVSIYPKLSEIYCKLDEQNRTIYQREYQLAGLEKEITMAKGIFKAKQKKELQEKAEHLRIQIANMKQRLSGIVRDYGYKNVQEFMIVYKTAKTEYNEYKTAFSKWEQEMEYRKRERLIAAKFQQQNTKTEEQKNNYGSYYYKNSR